MTHPRHDSARRALVGLAIAVFGAHGEAQAPRGYQDLTRLFEEWRAFQQPAVTDGAPDYTPGAMARQRQALPALQQRLASIDTAGWSVSQKIDKELVRAEMNGLEFDHRVLRPWSRNPCFYAVIFTSQSDVPAREGPVAFGAIELWQYTFPLPPARLADLRARLQAIPRLLDQAKTNLTEDARDLWFLGIKVKEGESQALATLETTLRVADPEIAPDAARAKQAVDGFREWLLARLPQMKGASGVGVANYDWYMRNVHLSPLTWADERALMERELGRATAQLKLEEQRNRGLPPLRHRQRRRVPPPRRHDPGFDAALGDDGTGRRGAQARDRAVSGEPAPGVRVRGPLVVAWLFGLAVGLLASLAIVVTLGLLFAPGLIDDLRAVAAARTSAPASAPPAPPAPAPTPRPVPRMPAPRYLPADATRSAPDAYTAMVHASQRGDAATVAKYLLRSELARRQPVEEALRALMPPVPIEALDLVRWKAIGDRAALLFKAQAPGVLDAKRKQAPIQVVVRMAREDGYWKMFRQTWLINAALGQHESEALAWAATGAR